MQLEDNYHHQGKRKQLVKILESKGISDADVLKAIGEVPRHWFIRDSALIEHIYEDKAFPIGENQTISQPYTVAYQTILLDVKPFDRILEVGTGSGYQASVLAKMGAKVFSIERQKKLYDRFHPLIQKINGNKVQCFFGDGFAGLPQWAPFDKMIITAAAPYIPDALKNQLKIRGFIVAPVGEGDVQQMKKVTRVSEDVYEEETFDNFHFVPMLKGLAR